MSLTFNKRNIFSRNRVILSILIFGLFVFVVSETSFSSWLWTGSKPFTAPIVTEIRDVRLNIFRRFDGLFNVSKLQTENKKLRSKINIMSAKMVVVDDLLQENELLRNQLGVMNSKDLDIVLASVIQSDDNNYLDKLYLDVGLKQGVNIGDYCIFENVFFGKLVDVQENFSLLQLLSDVDSVFPVRVESADILVDGILNGELSKDSLRVKNVEREHQIDIGAKVFLSNVGSNSTVPFNFLIGSVSNIISDDASIYSELKVTPSIDYDDVADLFILTK